MTIEANDPAIAIAEKPASLRPVLEWIARRAEPVVIGLAAILIGLALFSSSSWRSASRRSLSSN